VAAYDFDVIFTLEARSNFMLDVITKRFNLCEARVLGCRRECSPAAARPAVCRW
jgi:hypothetical protein